MIHPANQPSTIRNPDAFRNIFIATALAGLALSTPGVSSASSPEAEASAQSKITSIERAVNQRLDDNQLVPTANGVLVYKVTSSDPYTGMSVTNTVEERNPLVKPIDSSNRLKQDHNLLTSKKFTFGRIDTAPTKATTHFMHFNAKDMKFTPSKHGHQIRWVKFPDTADGSRLDFGKPLQANGKQYVNELFGISALQGDTPNPYPPQT